MNRGYVRFYRKALDSGWIRNHKLWAFWSWCLLKATHKEYGAIVGLQVVHLTPGQFIFGLKKAAEETGLTIREVRTVLDFLKKAQNVTVKTTNKYSVITIVNWESYQGDSQENGKQNDKPRANKGQHTNTIEHKNIYQGALEVLDYLNAKTGKYFEATKYIEARLRDGGTVEQCKRIIDTKSKDPHFIANPKYLNPTTLFRPSHWDQYLNEATEPTQRRDEPQEVRMVACSSCGEPHPSFDLKDGVCFRCGGGGSETTKEEIGYDRRT